MKKIFYILIFIVIYFGRSYSQSDSLKSFLPLQIGNQWQYKITSVFIYDTTIYYKTVEILKDTILSGQRYFVKNHGAWPIFFHNDDTLKYLRYDSSKISVVEYTGFGEEIFFKLDALTGECWENVCCSLADTVFVFGEYRIRKEFGEYEVPQVWGYSVVKDIGPVKTFLDDSWSVIIWTRYELVYAKINGLEYGSYVTDVNDKSSKPNSFILSQNYPNPFNPTTKIKYQIPQTGFVTLKVYDLIGGEVATLVNEEKLTGEYEVEFNGTNLSSGVYFYRLKSGNYTETKKLVFIR